MSDFDDSNEEPLSILEPPDGNKPKYNFYGNYKNSFDLIDIDPKPGKKIGKGTYSKVYTGSLGGRDPEVAIKKYKMAYDDGGLIYTNIREISILRRCRSRFIISILAINGFKNFPQNPEVSIVMPLINTTLKKLLPLDNTEYLIIAKQFLKAVYYLHSRYIVHLDLKPQNILVATPGPRPGYALKLCDFSLAKDNFEHPVDNEMCCTLWYKPPELLRFGGSFGASPREELLRFGGSFGTGANHPNKPRTFSSFQDLQKFDIWSIGCILYEMGYGKTLFPGKNDTDQFNLIIQKQKEISITNLNPHIPKKYQSVLLNSITINPEERPNIFELTKKPLNKTVIDIFNQRCKYPQWTGKETEHNRKLLLFWLFEVCLEKDFPEKVIHFAIWIVDCLWHLNIKCQEIQLYGGCALLIAHNYIKSCDELIYDEILDILPEGEYNLEQIKFVENKILNILEFDLNQTLAYDFLRVFSDVVPGSNWHMAYILLVLLEIDGYCFYVSPEQLAEMAIYIYSQKFKIKKLEIPVYIRELLNKKYSIDIEKLIEPFFLTRENTND